MPEYYQILAESAVVALEAMARAASEPMWTDVAGVLVAGVVGLGQCALIAWGIKVMKGSNESREANMEASRNQHEATMKALQDQGQVLADIGAGIREVLERTATDQRRMTA